MPSSPWTVTHSDGTAGTSYDYDMGSFGKGRLSSITRSGQSIVNGYDRFGRLTQDGPLGNGYDANGNRTRLTYPNGVAALYTHDFADREATLTYEQGGIAQPPAIVTASAYEPFGPLTTLTLGNGLTETRLFDARYFPDRIQVPGRLDWDYTLDAVGNPLQIADLLTPSQGRTYSYQDPQYFLTQGDGPWGTRSWTYDRIGNRLTETRDGVTDTYGYTGGNPRLQTVTTGAGGGTKYFAYDPVGNQTQDSRPRSELQFDYDAAGRLTRMEEATTETESFMSYDGRGFLREARQDLDLCSPLMTQATYTSQGLLVHRAHQNALAPAAGVTDEAHVFYFSGRPVALVEGVLPALLARKYLTADHLGTPVLVTSSSAVTVWSGGFEAFGADWSGGQEAGIFLRFPGQWEDGTWKNESLSSSLAYNVRRWYTAEKGGYSQPDPLALHSGMNLFQYSSANPLRFTDALGLEAIPYSRIVSGKLDAKETSELQKCISCPCGPMPPIPPYPPGASIQRNMESATNQPLLSKWFYSQVRNRGPWDYKQQGRQYQDFGNFNFGATGNACGFPLEILLKGAGWAQTQAGTSSTTWGNPGVMGIGGEAPYGDDPTDQEMIQRGFAFYQWWLCNKVEMLRGKN